MRAQPKTQHLAEPWESLRFLFQWSRENEMTTNLTTSIIRTFLRTSSPRNQGVAFARTNSRLLCPRRKISLTTQSNASPHSSALHSAHTLCIA